MEKRAWQMTREEFGVPEMPIIPEVQRLPRLEKKARDYPENLTLNETALLSKIKLQKKERAKALKLHKLYVEKSNQHINAVVEAKKRGETIPENVLADYPYLA